MSRCTNCNGSGVNPTDTTNPRDDELRERIEIILAANMPIHPEHQIDRRNILQNIMQLIHAHDATREREIKRELLLKLGRGDPESSLVFQARIGQELSSIELAIANPNQQTGDSV